MKLTHLSEQEIQRFAELGSNNTELNSHVAECQDCQLSVENYQSMFKAIEEAEVPIFDFDLADLVLAQLPLAKPQYAWLPALAASLSVIFSAALVFYYGSSILEISRGISPIWILIIVCPAVIITALQFFSVYQDYSKKFSILNEHNLAT
ncbi:hypothetical protein [Pedobacter duraquae]|uniref:Uncharacterized protein n=1 Tax=Pedobacter duraquae TaxID=425511 RepID=A0A4R6IPI8_9SPHI|nr:hypothetical protein [Pedobacter duraquae]TDO23916.1 hypothetical protein CLV32_0202 [Pedobacter duraquae]